MKSFKAKLYIEDNLATIEFDVTMKGKYDEDYTIGWNFGIIESGWKKKKGDKIGDVPPTLLSLSIYNEDDMRMVGEIVPTHQNADYQKGKKSYEDYIMTREISLQFLDLWLKGKQCRKYNYIYPYDEPTHLPLPQKHIRKQDFWMKKELAGTTPPDVQSWDIYIKKPGETEFVYHKKYGEEINPDADLEMRDVYEQIKHGKLSKTYPDGMPAKTVPTARDEDGNLKPKEN